MFYKFNTEVLDETMYRNAFKKYGKKYVARYPLYKYKDGTPLITLKITIDTEDNSVVDTVIDECTSKIYAQFYNSINPLNNVVKIVHGKYNMIIDILKKEGILLD